MRRRRRIYRRLAIGRAKQRFTYAGNGLNGSHCEFGVQAAGFAIRAASIEMGLSVVEHRGRWFDIAAVTCTAEVRAENKHYTTPKLSVL